MFFGFSFASAVVGVNSEILAENPQFLQQQSMIFSVGTIVIGFMILLFIIRTIDSAAVKIPIPELEALFASGLKKESVRRGVKRIIGLCIRNDGEDVAEGIQLFANFPPEFRIQEGDAYRVSEQRLVDEFPHHNAVVKEWERLHVEVTQGIEVMLTMPEKEGVYEIPILIYEKKTGKNEDKLIIEVVK